MIFRVTLAMTNFPKYKSLYTDCVYRLIPVITKIIYAPVCSGRDVTLAGSVSAFSIFFQFCFSNAIQALVMRSRSGKGVYACSEGMYVRGYVSVCLCACISFYICLYSCVSVWLCAYLSVSVRACEIMYASVCDCSRVRGVEAAPTSLGPPSASPPDSFQPRRHQLVLGLRSGAKGNPSSRLISRGWCSGPLQTRCLSGPWSGSFQAHPPPFFFILRICVFMTFVKSHLFSREGLDVVKTAWMSRVLSWL